MSPYLQIGDPLPKDKKYVIIFASQCCNAAMFSVDMVTEKTSYGFHYFYKRCSKCEELCDSKVVRVFDGAGNEVLDGDVVECPELPDRHAEKWHAVYHEARGNGLELEIRDIGNNNRGMYDGYQYYTRGPYWQHLDKLTDEDLQYYWNTTRQQAESRCTKLQQHCTIKQYEKDSAAPTADNPLPGDGKR